MLRVAEVTTWKTTIGMAIEELFQGSSLVFSSKRLELVTPVFAPCPMNSCKDCHREVNYLKDVVEMQFPNEEYN